VIVVDENHDIGGHAMVSGGRIPLGGGTSFQRRYGIEDSAEQVFLDHTNHAYAEFRYSDAAESAVVAPVFSPAAESAVVAPVFGPAPRVRL
jgi:hypothetical protein